MARGIHEAFVYQPINVARDLGAKLLGRLVDIQRDPDVPLPLDEAGVDFTRSRSPTRAASVAGRRAGRRSRMNARISSSPCSSCC